MEGYTHIDDTALAPLVGMAVRIGSTGLPWAGFEGKDGEVVAVQGGIVTVRVPGLGDYQTTGYNLWVPAPPDLPADYDHGCCPPREF
jgi:hypothetical protein